MTEKRKPKYLPDDFEFGEGPDAFFAAVIRRLHSEDAQAEEPAERKPEPQPEEARPVRRRSQLLAQRPRWNGKRKSDPAPGDANT